MYPAADTSDMERPDRLGGLLVHTRYNAALAWMLVVGMGATALASAIEGAILWAIFVPRSSVPSSSPRSPSAIPP